jgi:hypothetical protein
MHALALLALLPLVVAVPVADQRAPLLEPRGLNVEIVPNKYIVKMRDTVSDAKIDRALGQLGSVKADHVYKGKGFKGFASMMNAATLENLQNDPDVRCADFGKFGKCPKYPSFRSSL